METPDQQWRNDLRDNLDDIQEGLAETSFTREDATLLMRTALQVLTAGQNTTIASRVKEMVGTGTITSQRRLMLDFGLNGMGPISRAFKRLGITKGEDGVYRLPKGNEHV